MSGRADAAGDTAAFVAGVGVPTLLCAAWIALDGSWPHDDDWGLFKQAACLTERLTTDLPRATTACSVGTPYPPLVPLVPALGFFALGHPSLDLALQTQTLWTALLAAACWWGVRAEGGRLAALAAAWAAPALFFTASVRNAFYTEPAMAALGAVCLAGLIRSDGMTRWRPALVAGVGAGLGLLAKWSFAFFLGPPMALAVAISMGRLIGWPPGSGLRRTGASDRARAVAAALLGSLVALPWYWTMSTRLGVFYTSNVDGAYAGDAMPLARTWSYYPAALLDQVGVPLVAAAAVGLVLAARRRSATTWVALAICGGLLLLTLAPYRTGRYAAPAWPWLAFFLALPGPGAWRRALQAALAGWALYYQAVWLVTIPALDWTPPGVGSSPFPPGNTRTDLQAALRRAAPPPMKVPLNSPIPFYDPPAADRMAGTIHAGTEGRAHAIVVGDAGPMEMALEAAAFEVGAPGWLSLDNAAPGATGEAVLGAAAARPGSWVVEVRNLPDSGPDPLGEARVRALEAAGYTRAWERTVAGRQARVERVWAPPATGGAR